MTSVVKYPCGIIRPVVAFIGKTVTEPKKNRRFCRIEAQEENNYEPRADDRVLDWTYWERGRDCSLNRCDRVFDPR